MRLGDGDLAGRGPSKVSTTKEGRVKSYRMLGKRRLACVIRSRCQFAPIVSHNAPLEGPAVLVAPGVKMPRHVEAERHRAYSAGVCAACVSARSSAGRPRLRFAPVSDAGSKSCGPVARHSARKASERRPLEEAAGAAGRGFYPGAGSCFTLRDKDGERPVQRKKAWLNELDPS